MIDKDGMIWILIFTLVCLARVFAGNGSESGRKTEMIVYDFRDADRRGQWLIVNDGVMGGRSQSEFSFSEHHTAVFRGTVSLENNGGFASVRSTSREYALEEYTGIQIRLKGDGNTYQFRLRTNDRFDGIAYRYRITTREDEWMVVKIPFDRCEPVFRGRVLQGAAPLSPGRIRQIGVLIAEKQAGPFRLEMDWIEAFHADHADEGEGNS